MPATLIEIADGLEARLATIPGLRVYDHIPDVFAPPCAFVAPDTVEYWGAFRGGDAQHNYTITVVVGRVADRTSQKTLYAFMAYDGTSSVRAAIEADRTLGGKVQTLLVESAGNIRILQQVEQAYLAVDFSVRVHA